MLHSLGLGENPPAPREITYRVQKLLLAVAIRRSAFVVNNLSLGYSERVGWKEVIRKLKAAGFIEKRAGKGAHRLFVNPVTGKEVWVTMHGHDAGKLGYRILRDAGVE